jgi:chaperonin cofactor prefoldin
MTKREKILEAKREYWDALHEFEKARELLEKARELTGVYTIVGESEKVTGSVEYDYENDNVEITYFTSSITISGKSLRSLYSILGDLLSEAEQ